MRGEGWGEGLRASALVAPPFIRPAATFSPPQRRGEGTRRGVRAPIPHAAFRTPHSPGFTLLEVVLAITIAIGLLLVAMTFYQQSTSLRGQLMEEAERLAAVRQVMDRLAADLRVAPAHDRVGFTGDSNSLRFATTALPLASGGMQTDLRRVAYRATYAGDATNLTISGLVRTEEPAVDFITSALAPALATTPAPELDGDAAEQQAARVPNRPASAADPLTEAVRYLTFRFWDGAAWRESWSGIAPPPGVEVTLGFESLPPDATPEQLPGEVFRRVIFLPAGQPQPPETNLVANVNSR